SIFNLQAQLSAASRSSTVRILFFILRIQRPPKPTLIPYTTLFRSVWHRLTGQVRLALVGRRIALPFVVAYSIYARQRDASAHERSEEQTYELQLRSHLVCRLLLDKKNLTERIQLDYFRYHY